MFNKKFFLYILFPLILISVAYYLWGDMLVPKENEEEEILGSKSEKGLVLEIFSPKPNSDVECDFEVTGKMPSTWFFEGSFPVSVIVDDDVVFQTVARTEEDWTQEGWKTFVADISCGPKCVGEGSILLEKDNPSGLEENDDSYSIPVQLSNSCEEEIETMVVKVYFGDTSKDPDALKCETTYAIERVIPKTLAVGRASLEQLIEGPTNAEKNDGIFSSIPDGLKINSLKISNGVAYVDFNDKLIEGIGGSCLVSRISSQITNTLKQFPTVDSVVISVEGSTEAVLQP